MRRALATAVAILSGVLLVAGGAIFASGSAHVLATVDGGSGAGGDSAVSTAPATPRPPKPAFTPTPRHPAAGSIDVDPYEAPPGTSPEDAEAARGWVEQQRLIAACMADQGYDYPVSPPLWLRGELGTSGADWVNALPDDERDAAWLALFGDAGVGADYRWEDAGCDGYAVEATGMGDAH
ncbi:MAG: hypothetical protein Q7T71_16975 [Herbiconiux sp.]|nr:hypothetical protein [Herbiconiux sp.]